MTINLGELLNSQPLLVFFLTLGAAGGLLLTGLTIGFLRSYQPTFGSMPEGARYIFTEMGMMFFMANVFLTVAGTIIIRLS